MPEQFTINDCMVLVHGALRVKAKKLEVAYYQIRKITHDFLFPQISSLLFHGNAADYSRQGQHPRH